MTEDDLIEKGFAPEEARHMAMAYEMGFKQGQLNMQRHLRITLGLEAPTAAESAYWNPSIPLKEENYSDDT